MFLRKLTFREKMDAPAFREGRKAEPLGACVAAGFTWSVITELSIYYSTRLGNEVSRI